jgi:hypothetical protein
LDCLQKALSSDKNEKSRRRAAGALTNLSCDETAESMADHQGLLDALALVSAKDESPTVQRRACMALTKISSSVTVHMQCFPTLLDALIVASLSTEAIHSISAVFRVKARDPENRVAMAKHTGVLDILADVCINNKSVTKDLEMIKDRDNAMRAIMHLANESKNCKIMCNEKILDALVQGASISDADIRRTTQLEEIRDSAIRAIERLATEFSNRATMARHDGLLVAIAQATEREAKLEAAMIRGGGTLPTSFDSDNNNNNHNNTSTSTIEQSPFLAKPLLMILLVAM